MSEEKKPYLYKVRIDPDILKAIREYCKRTGRSITFVINRAIEVYLEKEGKKK